MQRRKHQRPFSDIRDMTRTRGQRWLRALFLAVRTWHMWCGCFPLFSAAPLSFHPTNVWLLYRTTALPPHPANKLGRSWINLQVPGSVAGPALRQRTAGMTWALRGILHPESLAACILSHPFKPGCDTSSGSLVLVAVGW